MTVYNGEGDLYEIRNYRTGRASFFEYDHAGRCMASTERAFTVSGDTIHYGAALSSYRYEYDVCNNLTKLTCSVAGASWDTVYTYDKDNRPKKTTLSSGVQITNTYNALGLVSSKTIGLSTPYETKIYYLDVGDGARAPLIEYYKNGNEYATKYEYDDNGNISRIVLSNGTNPIAYEYDAANRLTRENNRVTNETVTYEYDDFGNILNKKTYAYTTATLPATPVSTVYYTYANSGWKDQLTSYNGQTITYDAMGNPLTYRGYTFTWQGKQLMSSVNGSQQITFEYNEDGLRQRKTVNGTDTDYFYNGSVLIGMQRGTSKFLFSYDASGNVVSVKFNGTEYYYLRNAQGDIVKLIDASGATVVEYIYNTWGKKVTTTGSLAGTLGLIQPFRYRGYVYDFETGFYYLQSRYYDPTTGRFISSDVLLSTGQGVLGHNAYAYCLDNPVNMVDDGGNLAAPWWALLEDWGAIHRIVQKLICDKYKYRGMTSEKVVPGGRIDLIDQNGFIWEVKPALTPYTEINDQLTRYLKGKDGTKLGTGIEPYYGIETINGFDVKIVYWEDSPGVIYYCWWFADLEASAAAYAVYKAWKVVKQSQKVKKTELKPNYGEVAVSSLNSVAGNVIVPLAASVLLSGLVLYACKTGGGSKGLYLMICD